MRVVGQEIEEANAQELQDEGIIEVENGWKTTIVVAPAFYKFIIGKKGTTKNRIETESGCKVKVPRPGVVKVSTSVTRIAHSLEFVVLARRNHRSHRKVRCISENKDTRHYSRCEWARRSIP